MNFAGIDLAWQSARNPSAIAIGHLSNGTMSVTQIHNAVKGSDVYKILKSCPDLKGIAIDAPLIINNASGQRGCEKEIGKEYGSRHCSCHTSNTHLYPNASSVALSKQLEDDGFHHMQSDRWQMECYPHPAIVEIFGLPERLKYKKGRVAQKKQGQKELSRLILSLQDSPVLKLNVEQISQQFFSGDHIDGLRGKALKSNEDALDAIICLYVAGLYSAGQKERLFGNRQDGYIWVPQVKCV